MGKHVKFVNEIADTLHHIHGVLYGYTVFIVYFHYSILLVYY